MFDFKDALLIHALLSPLFPLVADFKGLSSVGRCVRVENLLYGLEIYVELETAVINILHKFKMPIQHMHTVYLVYMTLRSNI